MPPGGEGKVEVTFRSGDRRRQLRQSVVVRTNDPAHESVTLLVTANVLVDLEVEPNLLRFDPQHSPLAALVIKNHTDAPVQLSEVYASSDHVDLSLSASTIPPRGEVSVTGKLLSDAPQGVLSGWLYIRTDLKTLPLLQVRIWGNLL